MRDPELVMVLASEHAWSLYRNCGAVLCHADELGDSGRVGFYSGRQIQGVAPRIQRVVPHVQMSQASAARMSFSMDPDERRFGELLAATQSAALGESWTDETATAVLLSSEESRETVRFASISDPSAETWTSTAKTVRLSSLLTASTSRDVVEADQSPSGPDS